VNILKRGSAASPFILGFLEELTGIFS